MYPEKILLLCFWAKIETIKIEDKYVWKSNSLHGEKWKINFYELIKLNVTYILVWFVSGKYLLLKIPYVVKSNWIVLLCIVKIKMGISASFSKLEKFFLNTHSLYFHTCGHFPPCRELARIWQCKISNPASHAPGRYQEISCSIWGII